MILWLGLTWAAPAAVTVNGIDAAAGGAGWSFANGVVTLTNAGPFMISGENRAGGVRVMVQADATVTLCDAALSTYGYSGSALALGNGVTATLNLAGTNELISAEGCAGVSVPATAALVIARAPGYLTGVLDVVGGSGAAGVGGTSSQTAVGAVTVRGGVVKVTGGTNAAGIGGGFRKPGGTVSVTGGTLWFDPKDGADIGAGARANTSGSVTISGGSVGTARITSQPVDAQGHAVHCVTVTNLAASAKALFAGLGDYGQTDLVADNQGQVYLWLTNGVYAFQTATASYTATVADGPVTATQKGGDTPGPGPDDPEPEPVLEPEEEPGTPVRINGRFVSEGPAPGDLSWTYAASVLTLTGSGPYVLSGSDVTGGVRVVVTADATVRLSNLVLTNVAATTSSFAVNAGVSLQLLVGGTNVLASGQGAAGLQVPSGAQVTIGARDARAVGLLTAAGGQGGAGIGGPMFAGAGAVVVTGATVVAEAGMMAKAIGGGVGGAGGAVTILGGSVQAADMAEAPTNALGEAVFCVTVPELEPGMRATLTGLEDYGVEGLVANVAGEVYLWLTNGVYAFQSPDTRYAVTVTGASATATAHPRITAPTLLTITAFSWAAGEASFAFMTDLDAAALAAWCATGALVVEQAPTPAFEPARTQRCAPVLDVPVGTQCTGRVSCPAASAGFLRLVAP